MRYEEESSKLPEHQPMKAVPGATLEKAIIDAWVMGKTKAPWWAWQALYYGTLKWVSEKKRFEVVYHPSGEDFVGGYGDVMVLDDLNTITIWPGAWALPQIEPREKWGQS